MPSKCIVKNCNTGRKNNLEKFSMFKAPGNKETFDKWEAILRIFGSALKRCSFVCEKHFLPEEIKRVRYVRNSEGKMVETPLNTPRLKLGAIPSVFDWDESFEINAQIDECPFEPESSNSSDIMNFQTQATQTEDEEIKLTSTDNDRNDINTCDTNCNNLYANSLDTRKEKKSMLSLNYVTEEKGQTINHIFVKEVSCNDNENAEESCSDQDLSDQEMESEIDENKEIHGFSALIKKMKLPNGWIITEMDASKKIAFVKISSASLEENQLFIERQILLEKNGVLKIQIFNKSINLCNDNPKTIGELKSLINIINDLKICKGGPNKNEYENLVSQCAHIDQTNKWRHDKCDLIINKGKTCYYCLKLNAAFQKYSSFEDPVHEENNDEEIVCQDNYQEENIYEDNNYYQDVYEENNFEEDNNILFTNEE